MKIRTDSELFDKIDSELSWRRADLLRLRKTILDNKTKNDLLYKALLRSSIPMLYAHWEGFIKEASLSYLNYISIKKLTYKELNKGILAVYIQNEFINRGNMTAFEKGLAISNFFEQDLAERSNIKGIPDPIKTKSNLNSLVLKEIMSILDLDYEKFRGFEVFIDFKLVQARNKIAHGEFKNIYWQFYNEIYTIVIQLIEIFKDEIQNNVVLRQYLKATLAGQTKPLCD